MLLYIDTSDNTKTIVKLDDTVLERASGVDKSQQVLLMIEELLKEKKSKISDVTEIKIEDGTNLPEGKHGSFTGLRVGIAIANTLAWSQGILVNGKKMVEPKYE